MPEFIASSQNQWIKKFSALQHKKYRDEFGLFPVEGIRLVEELVRSDWQIEACLYVEEKLRQPREQALVSVLAEQGCRMFTTTSSILDKVADTEQPQGIIAVARKRGFTLAELLDRETQPLLLILDTLQDPGNVGAAIRTADATGCTGVILTHGCADVYAGKTLRATMGSLFHLPVVTGLDADAIGKGLLSRNIPLFVTALTAAVDYVRADFGGATAIVFGNEGRGVSEEFLRQADSRIHIPIYGSAESLNAAIATAVVLYEAARQRRQRM